SGPSFTATRVAEYEGAYYEVSRRAAASGSAPGAGARQQADRDAPPRQGASAAPQPPDGGDVELFPRSVQAPRLGGRPGRPAPQVEKLAGEQILRLVPPRNQPASGATYFHVLTSTVAVERVAIEVDGEKVAEDKRPPFRLRVPLARPAKVQTVRAVGYDGLGVPMAEDTVRINLVDAPFRVRITDFEGDPASGQVTLAGRVSVPADATLDRLEVWYNEELVETVRERTVRLDLQTPDVGPTDYLRLAAFLADGSSIDDVLLLAAPEVEEVDDEGLVPRQDRLADEFRRRPAGVVHQQLHRARSIHQQAEDQRHVVGVGEARRRLGLAAVADLEGVLRQVGDGGAAAAGNHGVELHQVDVDLFDLRRR
ncbi:MAG: hypothetical protein AAFY88_30285, partial [Acidobacteriota bacterium]